MLLKRFLNRVASAALAALIAVGGNVLVVNAAQTEQQRFDEFIEMLPTLLVGGSSMSTGFLYDDPEAAGIEVSDAVYSYTTKEDWDMSFLAVEYLYNQIKAFDSTQLDARAQYTQYVLLDALSRDMLTKDYFYLENNNLGSYLGAQANLPLLLAEFKITSEAQMNSYFNLLTTVPDAFKGYISIEKERQANGVGMSQDVITLVIEQCDNFTTKDYSFLYDVTNEKIDKISSMNATQKQQAKDRNKELVDGYLMKAYKDLRNDLAKIKTSAPKESKGLAHMKQGKAYYSALLRQKTGVDMNPQEAKKFLEERYNKAYNRAYQVAHQLVYDEPYKSMDIEASYKTLYNDYKDARSVIEYATAQAKRDYPDIGKMNYRIEQVPDAMKDNFSPAAFLTPALDKPASEPNVIYLNVDRADSSSNLYQTLIHEGVPGHMYQAEYYAKQNMPDMVTLFGNNGYIEGWATYVELRSHELVKPLEQPMVELDNLETEMDMLLMGIVDIGVHYEGWDKAQLKAFIKEKIGNTPTDESVAALYNQILETPCNSLTYILTGETLKELRETAETKLGSSFSAKEFHEVVLSAGPTSMTNVAAQVNSYIDSKSAKKAA